MGRMRRRFCHPSPNCLASRRDGHHRTPDTTPEGEPMSKVIFVTGAGRGLGTDIARESLAAGHQVVATGRRPEEVEKALGGPRDDLPLTKLDVPRIEDAESAVQAA